MAAVHVEADAVDGSRWRGSRSQLDEMRSLALARRLNETSGLTRHNEIFAGFDAQHGRSCAGRADRSVLARRCYASRERSDTD